MSRYLQHQVLSATWELENSWGFLSPSAIRPCEEVYREKFTARYGGWILIKPKQVAALSLVHVVYISDSLKFFNGIYFKRANAKQNLLREIKKSIKRSSLIMLSIDMLSANMIS